MSQAVNGGETSPLPTVTISPKSLEAELVVTGRVVAVAAVALGLEAGTSPLPSAQEKPCRPCRLSPEPTPCLLLFSFSSLLGFPLPLLLFGASPFLEGGADRAASVSGSREGHSDGIQWGEIQIRPAWEKWPRTPQTAPSPATTQPGGASEHHPPLAQHPLGCGPLNMTLHEK